MNQHEHIKSVLRRYDDLKELLDEKEKRRKVEKDSLSEAEEPDVAIAERYESTIEIIDLLQETASYEQLNQIQKSEIRCRESTKDLCERYGISLEEKFDFTLSDSALKEVDKILHSNGSMLYSEKFGYRIYQRDLNTLRSGEWLNDNIINCFTQLAQEKAISKGIPCHCFNTFFFKKLSTNGYSSVCRWTKKIDLFSLSRIIIPINTHNTHWTMAYIDMEKKEICYCDSMGGSGSWVLSVLIEYLKEEYKQKKGKILDEKEWILTDRGRSIPQQNNCSDCGVFTCANCLLACLKMDFSYNQKMIPLIRKYIVYCIIEGQLIYTFLFHSYFL